MRIRKRKVPLPLSLLSPVPLTDPHLFSRSPVQPDHNFTTPTCSSDHFSSRTCHSDTSASDLRHSTTTPPNVSLTVTGVKGVQMGNNDDASNASIKSKSGAPAYDDNDNNKGPLMSPLSNNEGRWLDGDRAIPLKKRRTMIMKCDVDKGVTATPSDQTASVVVNDDNGGGQEEVGSGVAATSSAKKGNSKRGNTIMEGSRCSRVNGRGWRCCQPTLVGYSLCEHHLGKGRLRSVTSTVKARSSSFKNSKNANNNNNNSFGTNHKFALGSHDGEKETTVDNNNNNTEKKMERAGSFGNSKRGKLGVVKARSLSSLLGQTNSMSMSNNFVNDHANVHQQENISN